MNINEIQFIEEVGSKCNIYGGVSASATASTFAGSSPGSASGGFSLSSRADGDRTSASGRGRTIVLTNDSSARSSSRGTARATARSGDGRTIVRSIDRSISRSISRSL